MLDELTLFGEMMIPDFDRQTSLEDIQQRRCRLAGAVSVAFGDELWNPTVRRAA